MIQPLGSLALLLVAMGSDTDRPRPADDRTFRPTVIVRTREAVGSGTIVASAPGESLVLTAAHVARGRRESRLVVELHRYNLGVERAAGPDGWPVACPAEVVAIDDAADVALLCIRLRDPLPYVARLASPGEEPARGAVVTSLGIDGGDHLASWLARARETVWFVDAGPSRSGSEPRVHVSGARPRASRAPRPAPPSNGDEVGRPFLITSRAPEHGRSGGGLFDTQGALVGVCVGRIEAGRDRGRGLFASVESVRRLIRVEGLEARFARPTAGTGGRDIVKPPPPSHNVPSGSREAGERSVAR